ncbi:MAG: hypothetical protein LJE68_13090 [Rhodobacter sp.]|nr:hypothetical protein [Rhodobacter sp.]
MKIVLKSILTAATLAVGASAAFADGPVLNIGASKLRAIQTNRLQRNLVIPQNLVQRGCVDLAVFAEQTRVGDRVRVTYGVRNVSSINYVSGPSQQAIVFAAPGRTLANHAFAGLNAGQSLSWSAIVNRPLEFPSNFSVIYSYDPDLYIDGNTANDDCNRANNQRNITVASN